MIHAVAGIFSSFGWVFREQHILDFGIDAHVEVREAGSASGRMIALQIKSAESYFKKRDAAGFLHRISDRHYQYWRGYCLPVFLVLYHPVRREAFWCVISEKAIRKTGKMFCVTVPENQRLDLSAASAVARYAISNSGEVETSTTTYWDTRAARLPQLLDVLANAQRTLDVASPFLDERLLWALSTISHRSVRVRLVVGASAVAVVRAEVDPQEHSNLQVRTVNDLHARAVVIDRSLSICGSANFCTFNWRLPFERVEASTERGRIDNIGELFNEIWDMSVEIVGE
jgi:phosphatidylserine/phosphatidylglycerophosphate/cardiolipin synthase-like enzyme